MSAEQLGSAEVGIQRSHDMITRCQRLKHRHGRGHSRRERDCCRAAFELRERRFQRISIWVSVPNVLVA